MVSGGQPGPGDRSKLSDSHTAADDPIDSRHRNEGELVRPHVVSRIIPGDERNPKATAPLLLTEKTGRRLSISPATLSIVREGLEQAVESPKGTAHKTVAMKEVAIAGKTGTAQTGIDKPSHAWFIGYFPARKPRYAIAVVLEEGGSGGKNAGPIAQKMIQAMLELGLIETAQDSP